jgi:hypothetical protein
MTMKPVTSFVAIALLTSGAFAQPRPAFSSLQIDLDRACQAAGRDGVQECGGHGGYRLAVYTLPQTNQRALDIYRGSSLTAASWRKVALNFGTDGHKDKILEWRLADGVPFALIARLVFTKGRGQRVIWDTTTLRKHKRALNNPDAKDFTAPLQFSLEAARAYADALYLRQ